MSVCVDIWGGMGLTGMDAERFVKVWGTNCVR